MSVIYDKSYDNRTKRPTPLVVAAAAAAASAALFDCLSCLAGEGRQKCDKRPLFITLRQSGKGDPFNSSTIVTFRVILATRCCYYYVLRCRPSYFLQAHLPRWASSPAASTNLFLFFNFPSALHK